MIKLIIIIKDLNMSVTSIDFLTMEAALNVRNFIDLSFKDLQKNLKYELNIVDDGKK